MNGDLNSIQFVFYSDAWKVKGTGHLNTELLKVCYSDVAVIQMLVIQIPTVDCSNETLLINTAGFRLVKHCGLFIHFKDFVNLLNTAVLQ